MVTMRSAASEAWDQVFLLSLFADTKEPLDNLKVQKIVFLAEDEARRRSLLAAHFPFYRNKFGPYSPALANDVRQLEDCGFIYPETRQPTKRGYYVLEYAADDIKESAAAHESIGLLQALKNKYENTGSFVLKDLVYEIQVPVTGLRGEMMKVKDIPMRTTIIHPIMEKTKVEASLPDDLLEDIAIELSFRTGDLDPDSPSNVLLAREVLHSALA
jgi:hypothetical protein